MDNPEHKTDRELLETIAHGIARHTMALEALDEKVGGIQTEVADLKNGVGHLDTTVGDLAGEVEKANELASDVRDDHAARLVRVEGHLGLEPLVNDGEVLI